MSDTFTYTFSEISSILGGKVFGRPDLQLQARYLLTDSRQLTVPRQSIFFAIVTRKNNGHLFVRELLEKGVRMFVVSEMDMQWVHDFPDAGFIVVNGTDRPDGQPPASVNTDAAIAALQRLAAYHRSLFRVPVIGITGSNGKTIIKEWLFQLLHDDYHIVRNPRSYNSQTGVPLSVWQMTAAHNLALFEAGISTVGEMALLGQIIHPTIGIITNIGPAHDSGFTSRAEKTREKLRLFEHAETLIYCADHTDIASALEDASVRPPGTFLWGRGAMGRWGDLAMGRLGEGEREREGEKEEGKWRRGDLAGERVPGRFSWGRGEDVDVRLVEVEKKEGVSKVVVQHRGEEFLFAIPFADDASVENAMHCLCVMLLLEVPAEVIADRMPMLQPIAMRLEMKEGINGCSVINDSYNSDLASLAIALDFLNSQTRYDRTTLIISDILQTGLAPAMLYRQVADLIIAKKVGRIIGIGPDISSQSAMFGRSAMFYPDTDTFLREYDFTLFKDEAILLKGARPFTFEKLGDRLQQKDHQTVLEVDLDALVHNLNVFRSQIDSRVRVMAMVKAFSYGSGSVEIASVLQYHHVDYLAVAYADEGKTLRQGGIRIPFVVMNPEVRSFDTLVAYNLEPEIYSLELLERFSAHHPNPTALQSPTCHAGVYPSPRLSAHHSASFAVQSSSRPPASSPPHPDTHYIHLKLDTGMHRLGILPHQLPELIAMLKEKPHLRVASVFSHLAASGDPGHDAFTLQQIDTFRKCCDALEKGLGYGFVRHISNSDAAVRFPDAHFDMVRLGIGLYGISSDPGIQGLLQHVSNFRSVVSQVKTIRKGETIGYNRAAVATDDMVIAVVPVGYADGFSRRLGNGRGTLLIGGQRRPVVGNISMDMCTVDVTGMDVKPGEEVIIFGRERSVQEFAQDMDTIPYEVLTSVSHRVKRVYVQG